MVSGDADLAQPRVHIGGPDRAAVRAHEGGRPPAAWERAVEMLDPSRLRRRASARGNIAPSCREACAERQTSSARRGRKLLIADEADTRSSVTIQCADPSNLLSGCSRNAAWQC